LYSHRTKERELTSHSHQPSGGVSVIDLPNHFNGFSRHILSGQVETLAKSHAKIGIFECAKVGENEMNSSCDACGSCSFPRQMIHEFTRTNTKELVYLGCLPLDIQFAEV